MLEAWSDLRRLIARVGRAAGTVVGLPKGRPNGAGGKPVTAERTHGAGVTVVAADWTRSCGTTVVSVDWTRRSSLLGIRGAIGVPAVAVFDGARQT